MWIKRNIGVLLILSGYYFYDNFHMIFYEPVISVCEVVWTSQDKVYKLGILILFFIIAFVHYISLPKLTDKKVIMLGILVVFFRDLVGYLLKLIGYNIEFLSREGYNLGWIFVTALPVFSIIICLIGKKKWLKNGTLLE